MLSDIDEDLKRIEHSLSSLSSHLTNIVNNGADAKSKIIGLNGNVDKLERDVREIRRKLETKKMSQ